jgi:CxxC motif-containing protein
MVRGWLTGLVVVGTVLGGAGPASAVIPTGNLLANNNPGTEAGSASSTGNDVFTLDPWTREAGSSPRATAVRYGAPGFPTVAQGQALGGGRSFFAGGPSAAGDNNGSAFSFALLEQKLPVPATAEEDIDAGNVQFTVSGCLGGYATQDDQASVAAEGQTTGGAATSGIANAAGPTAAERGNQTELLGRSATVPLGPGTRSIEFVLDLSRQSGAGTYNDAYADNLALRLSPSGGPAPGADCPPAGGGSGGGTGGNGKQTGSGGANTAVPISRVGKRLTLKGHDALVKLHCSARDTSCKGTLSLATTGLPKAHKTTIANRAKAAKLGSAKFTIASGKTKTIKVKLKRSIRKRLAKLSAKRLKKLKITATAKIGAESTKFSLGAVRKH